MKEMQHWTMFPLKEELVITQVLMVYQRLLHGIDFQVYYDCMLQRTSKASSN